MYSTGIFAVPIVLSLVLLFKKDKPRIQSLIAPFILALSVMLYAWFEVYMEGFKQPSFIEKIQLSSPYFLVIVGLVWYSRDAFISQKMKALDAILTIVGSVILLFPLVVLIISIWK